MLAVLPATVVCNVPTDVAVALVFDVVAVSSVCIVAILAVAVLALPNASVAVP